ncbi:uncharacterized protein LOC115624574 [Scaptodrosophila lebanonensis]|uniref:Uncharacterized protein LOC115624574 n=1 Tax=Drosophila lebanonensis TaxID=7225 RepID=A0A6J2TIA0_DROLE|nr:uncharacterized protein LOC115624574 [Scaptodrosophila lebanonensis]
MRLMKCCCCIPLRIGVIITGIMFGSCDTILGSIGLIMAIRNEYPMSIHEFFDKLDVRLWVSMFSATLFLMSCGDLLLVYGAVKQRPGYMGPWLLVNFFVGIGTIVTALLSSIAILRIIILYYCMFVVSSYYDELMEERNNS